MMYWFRIVVFALGYALVSGRYRQNWWVPPLFALVAYVHGFLRGVIYERDHRKPVDEDRYTRS